MNGPLELPSLATVDREIRRRQPPHRLDFLGDWEYDEFRAAVDRRDVRTANRLVRRAERRMRHKLPGSTRPWPPGAPEHRQTRRYGADRCITRLGDWQSGELDYNCRCVIWVLDGPDSEADRGDAAIWERHRYVARVREERRKRREAPPVEVVPRLPGGRWQSREADPVVDGVRGRPVPGTPLRVLDGGRDREATSPSSASPVGARLPRRMTTDELAALLGVPVTEADPRAPRRQRAHTTNGDPNTSSDEEEA